MVSYLYPFDDDNEKAPDPQGLDENERVVIVVTA